MRRTKVIDRPHQEHPLVQRQGVACQRPAPARQRREAFPKRWVVYLYRAGNSVARKSGTIPPYHDHVRGTLPWYRTSFSPS
jgi:hypothetical protein